MNTYKISLSGSSLKIFAIVIMLIDHIGAILLPQYHFLRYIGRLAFPIFCFLLVEGFFHTRDIKKYALRLGLFALISEIPFDLALSNVPFNLLYQNVFFTLFIGLLVLIGFEKFKDKLFLRYMILVLGMLLAEVCHVDYGCFGIIMIVLFYFYSIHNNLIVLTLGVLFFSILSGGSEFLCTFSIIPISLYNGKRGISLKYLFYAFYPVHLLILYLISLFLS